MGGLFATPRALEDHEIETLIGRYANVAAMAKDAGFSGVQIHAAHGYMASQFLSPHTNKRTDKWGGALENRARFLLRVVEAIRENVGAQFPVGVKLNSADFQRGGFTQEDALQVAQWLDKAGIDLLEISGGNYESPAMMSGSEQKQGPPVRASTAAREAYFIVYAEQIRAATTVPLLVTGGFRSHEAMEDAIASGSVDAVGMARPLCIEPDLPSKLLSGESQGIALPNVRVGVRKFDDMLQNFWYQKQLVRMGNGKEPNPQMGRWSTLVRSLTQAQVDIVHTALARSPKP